MRRASLLVASVALVSCTSEIVERTVIDELRILAVQADPAEPPPGEAAFVSALVVDPLGEGRVLSYVWSVCVPDPVVGLESCEDPARLRVVSMNDAFPLVIDADFLDPLPPEEQEEGRDLFIVLAVSAEGPGTDRATAFKRIRVSTGPARNRNPQIDEFSVNGNPDFETPVFTGAEVELKVRPSADSRELYDPGDGEIMEEMRYSWWTTSGELEKSVSFGGPVAGGGTNKWKAVSPATLWVVLRDPRGGVTWGTHRIVEP